jgi:hypothetical protein
METCLNYLRIVKDHQGTFGQIRRQVGEDILPYLTVTIQQQLAFVALLQGELGDTLVRQGVVIIGYFTIHNS